MSTESDFRGRSFEYLIATSMCNQMKGKFTARATADNDRDAEKFKMLDEGTREDLSHAASAVPGILDGLGFEIRNPVIDRLPDDVAKGGDPTDIRIVSEGFGLHLSIKNNHFALKHQRPNSLMQQLGLEKGSPLDKVYRSRLKSVYGAFDNAVREMAPRATTFECLKNTCPGCIEEKLYGPVCRIVCETLNSMSDKVEYATRYFRFLVGRTDFLKIIHHGGKIIVEDFSSIAMPRTFVAEQQSDEKYIGVCFDNGWRIMMRLHTASSRFSRGKTPSLKFDTQLDSRYEKPYSSLEFRY